ncbi:MAG: penicillin-binding protein 2 [Clostridia bacterium]|nr:penicillin-binding protein 2 [Clostridia bacterium]
MKKQSNENKSTTSSEGGRSVGLFCFLMVGFVICCVNIVVINMKNNTAVAGINTSKTLVLGESRGIIYDYKFNRLVSSDYDYVCAVKPDISSSEMLRNVLDADSYVNVVNHISKGNPTKFVSPRFIAHKDIICDKIYKRYNNSQLASHLIGYVDYENTGVSGIEKSYNSLLESYSGDYCVRYFADGTGRVMNGADVEVESEGYNSKGGVVLTLDKNAQFLLEEAMDSCGIEKGAAALLDIKSGAIRAIVSRPNFNPNAVVDYLNGDSSPLFNRSIAAYPIGSVFKPLIAASALEQGVDPRTVYECKGVISDNNSSFNCTKSHGTVNMATALMYSCNCYFINLINKIDYEKTIALASSFYFGSEQEICNGIYSSGGNLPSIAELDSFAARANFSFGQGTLNATVLQIAGLYTAIANEGKFCSPYAVEGECDENGVFEPTHTAFAPHKVFSKETADFIAACLELAVREGTGVNAANEKFTVAGKTATAQTGEYQKGKERLVTWFAGFFPYDNPEYVLVIMCEDGESGSSDCAPVFSKVAAALITDQ